MIDGVYIPAGYDVGVSAYALHHNTSYHARPWEFRPERWIVDSDVDGDVTQSIVAAAKAAFIPFSLGSRGCVGKNLAYREIYLTLAMLVWRFEFRVAGDEGLRRVGEGAKGKGFGRERANEFQLRQGFSARRDGPWLEFRTREV